MRDVSEKSTSIEYENVKQLQDTTIKTPESKESKENKYINRLDESGLTGPGETTAPPLATALLLSFDPPL